MNTSDAHISAPDDCFYGSIEWKRAQLAAKDFSAMQKRDIVIEVSLGFDPTVYRWTPELLNANFKPIARRIRLSAGTKLSVFQDKILQPAFGCTFF